jgi:hypothetical protein
VNRYYEGTQPLTYMHPDILREVKDRISPVIIAWPQLIVDSVEERLDVEGFRTPDQDGRRRGHVAGVAGQRTWTSSPSWGTSTRW